MADDPNKATPPNDRNLPIIKNIFDFSAESLGQVKTWLEQNPPAIPVTQIIGYQANTVRVYKKAAGIVTVANTVTETDIVNEVIPSGSIGTTGVMRVTLIGDYLNNSGAAQNLTVTFYLGATTLHTVAHAAIPTFGNRYATSYECSVANLGATNSQMAYVEFPVITAATADAPWNQRPAATTAIDTTVAQTFRVTVTHQNASAQISFIRRYYMVEFL